MFNQFFFTFFISLTIISSTIGMNTSTSSSTGCIQYFGQIQHIHGMENIQKWVPNTDGAPKTLTLKNPLKNLTSISLSINGVMCTASTSQPVNCNINGDSNDGELIFKINGGKITVIVPFKNASFFSNNKCEIEIGDYDVNTHKLNIKINGANFVITQNSVTETIACKRGN